MLNAARARSVRLFAMAVALVTGLGGVAELAAAATTKTSGASGTRATTKSSTTRRATTKKKKRATYSRRRASSRRARLARARAARYARDMRRLATPQFKTDENGQLVPDVRAAAAVIYNPTTREIIFQENADDTRSIASITKVMTAVVFLENEFDLAREIVVDPVDVRGASTTYLRGSERLSADDLVHLLLVASDNAAARTLARNSPYGPAGFIVRMNEKATELGLDHTRYADPSGLDSGNVSSALDMARLIAFAAADERIGRVMQKPQHTISTSRRTLTFNNTNRLLKSDDVAVVGGKTGFIRSSGYCLATLLRLPQTNDEVAVVVLGARSNAGRFMETKHLLNWITAKAQLFGVSGQPQNIPHE